MFPRRQNKLNLPWSSNYKSLHPWLLMHCVSFWSISELFNFFQELHANSSVVLKYGSQNHTVIAGKVSNSQKMLERICGTWIHLLKKSGQFNLRTNKGLMNNYHKNSIGSSWWQYTYTFEWGIFYKFKYYNLLWIIRKCILCEIFHSIRCILYDPSCFV